MFPSTDFFALLSANNEPAINRNFLERIIAALDTSMDVPPVFGWYHILCLALMIGACALVVWKGKNISDKRLDWTLGIISAVMILFEVYKQFIFCYNPTTDTWGYAWYVFPFQFCSTPMYVMLAAALIKNRKIKTALHNFLATFSLFGGLIVMLYPGDVYTNWIGINIQTMYHHGVMVVVGVLMYVSGRVKLTHKSIFSAIAVFGGLITLATIGNVLYGELNTTGATCNLFFISPYFPSTLPVFSSLWHVLPYPLFLALYIVAFSFAAYLILLCAMLVQKMAMKIKAKKLS